jgi:hypothetical protein
VTHKQALELYRNMGKPAPPDLAGDLPAKYRAKRKEIDGISFSSTGEARAYQKLKLWLHAGIITDLVLQPRFCIIPASRDAQGRKVRPAHYVADFSFTRGGRSVVIDFKGFRTPAYRLKLKLFRQQYPEVDFFEWTKADLC